MKTDLPKLQTKHAHWIIDAALDSFLEKIKDAETELIRHEALVAVPLATKHGQELGARTKRIEYLKDFLRQYHDIVTVLAMMRAATIDANAAELAAQFKAHFR